MKKITIFTIIFLVIFVLILGIYFFKQKQIDKQEKQVNKIIFGTASGYAPFVSINANGDYEGLDIDVAHAIGDTTGKHIEILDLGSMTALFEALNRGIIDAIIWGLSITAERLEKYTMIRYQGEVITAYPMIFWGKIPGNIRSINDMNCLGVCVEPHSSQEAVLNKYPNIEKIPIEKVDDSLLFIKTKKADAAFVEPAIAKKFKAQFSDIIMLQIPLEKTDQVEGIGIAILPTNQAIIELIQSAVKKLTRQGVVEALEKKWNIS